MNQWMKPVIFKLMLLTEAVGKKKKERKEGRKENIASQRFTNFTLIFNSVVHYKKKKIWHR